MTSPAAPGPAPAPELRRLCRVVRALVAIGAAALLLLPLGLWASPEWLRELAPNLAGVRSDDTVVDLRARWLAAGASLLPVGVGLYALLQLWRLFGIYERGAALTSEAQQLLRRFAWALLASVVARPLYASLMSVALTIGNPPGKRHLVIGLSSDDYLLLLLGAVLLAIAAVMADAVRAASENREFV